LFHWSQLTEADAKIGLAVARDRLSEVQVDGVAHFLCGETANADAPARQHTPVLALPGFDEYLLGYRDPTHAIDADELARVVPGQNGIFLPLVVTNGRIVGTWRKKISASGLTGVAALFDDPITATGRARGEKAQRGFSRALPDYAKFLAVPPNPA